MGNIGGASSLIFDGSITGSFHVAKHSVFVILGYMENTAVSIVERIQALAAKTLATQPAGHQLHLIGGFRYRLLDASCRASVDIDYHWEGDLDSWRSSRT